MKEYSFLQEVSIANLKLATKAAGNTFRGKFNKVAGGIMTGAGAGWGAVKGASFGAMGGAAIGALSGAQKDQNGNRHIISGALKGAVGGGLVGGTAGGAVGASIGAGATKKSMQQLAQMNRNKMAQELRKARAAGAKGTQAYGQISKQYQNMTTRAAKSNPIASRFNKPPANPSSAT